MTDEVPIGSWKRALTGGQAAAKVGGKVMAYYAKRPFMSDEKASRAKEKVSRDGAKALFKGMSLLKGTALKMAQQLSLEIDLLPEASCRELAKAYHQVPPINRALVRKVVEVRRAVSIAHPVRGPKRQRDSRTCQNSFQRLGPLVRSAFCR